MPPTNPRIIVVDTRHKLHHLVRAALDLMDRRPRLIETYTGDDAMAELRISSPDLLITAHTLVDTTNGPMLALMAKRELAALPIIVVADEDDPELDEETRGQSPFQYLRRPFAAEAFIRALRIALDGPQAAPQEAAAQEIIEVPKIDADRLRPIMFRLMRDVGAMAAILADRNGKVVTYEGAAGYVDRELLAVALGPGFGSQIKILGMVGDQPRVLKHFEGERGNLFGLSVGLHHFLMLFFNGKAPASALGNVKRYGGAAVNEMLEIVGEVAFNPNPPPTTSPKPSRDHASGKRKTRTQEMTPVTAASAPAPVVSGNGAAASATGGTPAKAKNAIPNFDASLFDRLDSVDLQQANAMFDLDNMLKNGTVASGDRISFDDAMQQGILGDINE